MKVKGRFEKWIPGRPQRPPEEGAVGGEGVYRTTLGRQVSFEDNNSLGSDQASGLCLPSGISHTADSDIEERLMGRDGSSYHRFRHGAGSDSPGMSSITTQCYSIPSTSHGSSGSTCSFYTPGATSPGEGSSRCTSPRGSIGTNSCSLPGRRSFSASSSTIHHIVPGTSTGSSSSVPEINKDGSKNDGSTPKTNLVIGHRNSSPFPLAVKKHRSSLPSSNSEKNVFLLEPVDIGATRGKKKSGKMELESTVHCTMNIPAENVNTEEKPLHKLSGTGPKGGKRGSKSLKLQLDLQTINQPGSGDLGPRRDEGCEAVPSRVNCNGRIPKVKVDHVSAVKEKEDVVIVSMTPPLMTPSPNRKVTFHESVLQAAETRKLVVGDTVRIVRVRDAAVNTPKDKENHVSELSDIYQLSER